MALKWKRCPHFFLFQYEFSFETFRCCTHHTTHTINIIFVVKFIWRRANARNGRKRLKFRFYHYQLSVEHCIWPTGKIVKREIASINQSGSNGANGKKIEYPKLCGHLEYKADRRALIAFQKLLFYVFLRRDWSPKTVRPPFRCGFAIFFFNFSFNLFHNFSFSVNWIPRQAFEIKSCVR